MGQKLKAGLVDDPGAHQIKAQGPHGKDLGYGNYGCLESYWHRSYDN